MFLGFHILPEEFGVVVGEAVFCGISEVFPFGFIEFSFADFLDGLVVGPVLGSCGLFVPTFPLFEQLLQVEM